MLGIGLGPWRSRFICRLNMLFACKIVVPFPLSIGEILGYFFTINYIYFLTRSIHDPRGWSKAKVPGEKLWPPSKHTI
jgi:hypothetical protein